MILANPTEGQFSAFSQDGSFVYLPDDDFVGPGTFTYEVTDAGGLVDQATVTITFDTSVNRPPVVDVGGPYAVTEGGSLVLDGSGSTDPNQTLTSYNYAWDLDGDGRFGESGVTATRGDETGVTPTFSTVGLANLDEVEIALRITDQPRPNSKPSRYTLSTPQDCKASTVHLLAARIPGLAVRRGPISSARTRKLSITSERLKPSSRILLTISRSTGSSAQAKVTARIENTQTVNASFNFVIPYLFATTEVRSRPRQSRRPKTCLPPRAS
ncbi:MAG: cadherin-like domain-containing protein [Proteobacteria bacterium]|nr:cadherin-like domain-containing protein [Pseudomonadota bacterium]